MTKLKIQHPLYLRVMPTEENSRTGYKMLPTALYIYPSEAIHQRNNVYYIAALTRARANSPAGQVFA